MSIDTAFENVNASSREYQSAKNVDLFLVENVLKASAGALSKHRSSPLVERDLE